MQAVGGSVGDALGAATDALRAAGVESPRLDAELLLAEATGADRARLVADPGGEVAPPAGRRYGEMVRRRLRREPVAYILGRRGFRRIELEVDQRVLIPRPESELLVELALELEPESVLDVGTGSGAIALAIADELAGCRVTATDTSAAALEVAGANARRLGLADRVRFLSSTVPAGERFDLVVSNPPYVAESAWASLQPEITEWEPPEALLAGPDGFDAFRSMLGSDVIKSAAGGSGRRLSAYGRQTTTGTGVVAGAAGFEVGEGQAEAVAGLLRKAGFDQVDTRRDLAGIERVVVGRRSPKGGDL